jgi:hypothetical protein
MSIDIEKSFVTSSSTASTILTDIENLSVPVLLKSSGHIAAFMSLSSYNSNNNDVHFGININGVDSPIITRNHANMNDIGSVGIGYRTQNPLSPGIYYVKGRFFTDGGTLNVQNATLIAMPLSDKNGNVVPSLCENIISDTTISNIHEDIDGLSGIITLQDDNHLYSFLFGSTSSDTAGSILEFAINMNGQLLSSARKLSSASDKGSSSVASRTITQVSSGSNLIKGQWNIDSGTGIINPGILIGIGTEINANTIPTMNSLVSNATTTSGSLTDVIGASGVINLNERSYVFASLSLDSSADSPNTTTEINIGIDGIDQQSIFRFHSNNDLGSQIIFVRSDYPLSSGNHLIIARWSTDSGEVSGTNIHLSAMAGGTPSIFSSGTLFINGIESKSSSSCPTLDPDASIQISDELIEIYQERIDALINQLGKNVLLEFDPIRSPCPNCIFDPIRNRSTGIYIQGGPRPFRRGRQCPWCKGLGFEETQVQKCIKCLIRWNPTDAGDYGISLRDYRDVVRFKTHLTEFDDLVRAKTARSNYDIQDKLLLRVRLIKSPILIGLRESRYCISFWELIDS